jgi:hypothetical protein
MLLNMAKNQPAKLQPAAAATAAAAAISLLWPRVDKIWGAASKAVGRSLGKPA